MESKYSVNIEELSENTSHRIILSQITPGSTVLECGCASGYMTRYMKEKVGAKVSIVELNPSDYDRAKEYAVDGICADLEGEKWSNFFQGQSFDFILFADVLEHLRNPENVIKRAVELLKEDGTLIASIPNVAHADILINLLHGRWNYTPEGLLDNTHIHFWAEKNLDALFRQAGLSVVEKDYTILPPFHTEQKSEGIPEEMLPAVDTICRLPRADVYQFVYSAKKTAYVRGEWLNCTDHYLQRHSAYWVEPPYSQKYEEVQSHLTEQRTEQEQAPAEAAPVGRIPNADKPPVIAVDPTQSKSASLLLQRNCLREQFLNHDDSASPLPESVDIIVPVYNGFSFLEDLFRGLWETDSRHRILFIDDDSPDERVLPALRRFASERENVSVLHNEQNLGFVKTVNRGLKTATQNVVILNTDVELPRGWIERLMEPIFRFENVASVTPFSNCATIFSFPEFGDNELYQNLSADELDGYFRSVKPQYTLVPTGVGFCMGMSRKALDVVGLLDAELFDRGYGEENDWCQRASKAGFVNVHAENLFVYHKHGGSFMPEEKKRLIEEHTARLNVRHPNYPADVAEYMQKDPLKNLRAHLRFQIRSTNIEKSSILVFAHDMGGGADMYLDAQCPVWLNQGNSVFILRYMRTSGRYCLRCMFSDESFELELADWSDLEYLLRDRKIDQIIVNELVTYPALFTRLADICAWKREKGCRLTMLIHDYLAVSPSYNLLSPQDWIYAREGKGFHCDRYYEQDGWSEQYDCPSIEAWRQRWEQFLLDCDEVRCFSEDSRRIMSGIYPALQTLTVVPHAVSYLPEVHRERKTTATLNIGLLGTLTPQKGRELVRGVWELLEHENRNIKIILIGCLIEEKTIPVDEHFEITGRYRVDDLPQLVLEKDIDLFLIPSICPETFSYTTEEVMNMGFPIACLDLGAPAERVRTYEKGLILSSAEPRTVLRELCAFARELHLLPVEERMNDPTGTPAEREALLSELRARNEQLWEIERDLRQELAKQRAHNAKLEQTVRNKEGHIELLLQSERDLKRELAEQIARNAELEQTVRNKEGHIELLLESDRELERIHASRSWRVLSVWWRFRDALFPKNSRRRLLLKLGLKFLKHPIWFLKKLDMRHIKTFREGLRSGSIASTSERLDNYLGGGDMKAVKPELLPQVRFERAEDYPALRVPCSDDPMVSIIIPVYNEFAYTYACIRSIVKNTGQVPYEIIIADDCSDDLTKRLGEIIESVRIVRNETNLRFLKNCNHAAEFAKGKYILFLNNDTQVQKDWLTPLVKLIESADDIGMVGSKLVYPDGRLQEAGGIVWKDASAWNYGHGQDPNMPEYNYVKEADYISGAAIMIRAGLWREIGGFDERFAPAYYEDTDLAFTVRQRGYRVLYQPLSVVVHFEGISNGTDTSAGQKAYQVKNRKKFLAKWGELLQREHDPNGCNVLKARDHSQRKKHLLVVDHYVPHFDKDAGGRCTFMYLKLFVKLGFQVTFIGDNFFRHEPYTTILNQMGIEVLYGDSYFSGWKKWLKENASQFDCVYLQRPHIAIKYIDLVKENSSAKIIYFAHDLHHLRERREYEITHDPKLLESSKKWKRIEYELFEKADVGHVVGSYEQALMQKAFPGKPIRNLPLYIYEELPQDIERDFSKRKDLLYVGGFRHHPNIDAVLWFAREIFPQIEKAYPEIKWHIVGGDQTPEILALENEHILIHGFVSDAELEELYRSCKIAVVPLRYGAGVKGKVVEAQYYQCPLVTTSIGAEGLSMEENSMIVEDDAGKMAQRLIELYGNEEKLKALSECEALFIRRYFMIENATKVIKMDFIH